MLSCKKEKTPITPNGEQIIWNEFSKKGGCFNLQYDPSEGELGKDCGGTCVPCELNLPDCSDLTTTDDNELVLDGFNRTVDDHGYYISDGYLVLWMETGGDSLLVRFNSAQPMGFTTYEDDNAFVYGDDLSAVEVDLTYKKYQGTSLIQYYSGGEIYFYYEEDENGELNYKFQMCEQRFTETNSGSSFTEDISARFQTLK